MLQLVYIYNNYMYHIINAVVYITFFCMNILLKLVNTNRV